MPPANGALFDAIGSTEDSTEVGDESLRAIRPNEKLPVRATTDLKRPWPATDVAVPNQLAFALRIDVDLDVLEAVRTGQQRGVVHRRP